MPDGILGVGDHVQNNVEPPRRDTSCDYFPARSHNEDRRIGYISYYLDDKDVVTAPSLPVPGVLAVPSTSVPNTAPTVSSTNNAVHNRNVVIHVI